MGGVRNRQFTQPGDKEKTNMVQIRWSHRQKELYRAGGSRCVEASSFTGNRKRQEGRQSEEIANE